MEKAAFGSPFFNFKELTISEEQDHGTSKTINGWALAANVAIVATLFVTTIFSYLTWTEARKSTELQANIFDAIYPARFYVIVERLYDFNDDGIAHVRVFINNTGDSAVSLECFRFSAEFERLSYDWCSDEQTFFQIRAHDAVYRSIPLPDDFLLPLQIQRPPEVIRWGTGSDYEGVGSACRVLVGLEISYLVGTGERRVEDGSFELLSSAEECALSSAP